jgi:hypothetical protein
MNFVKPKLLLCLALVLIGGLFGCSTTASNHPFGLPLRYHNAQNNFTFFLPASWRGYSALIQQWNGETYSPTADKLIVTGHGPIITFRHPQWQTNAPYQDLPVLVFTRAQWDLLHQGKLWPSLFAGGAMDELWHTQKFVFAMSSRYNAEDDVKGWKSAADIIKQNCAVNKMPHLYPE